jgi:hypothetical protein
VLLEVVQQVEHLVAEGDVEIGPALGEGVGHRERQGPAVGALLGDADRSGGGVVAEALLDPGLVDQHPEQAAPAAAHVEHPDTRQPDIDGPQHGAPDEVVLVVHGTLGLSVHPMGWCRCR